MIIMGIFDIFKKKKAVFPDNEINTSLSEKDRKWNKMWELWADGKVDSPYAQLMAYQSEINNGGHDQYFTNVENVGDLQIDLEELEKILPLKLNENVKKAYQAYLILEENEDDEKPQEILEQCDDVFYENEQEINHILEEYSFNFEL